MREGLPAFLKTCAGPTPSAAVAGRPRPRLIDRALKRVGSVISAMYAQWELASGKGLLQAIDGRIKLVCLLFLLVVATVKNTMAPGLVLAGGLFLLVCLSRLRPSRFYPRIAVLVFFFGFLVVLPASLNIVTPGRVVLPLVRLGSPRSVWIYTVPQELGVTAEGLRLVGLLALRMFNCLSVSLLLFETTPFPKIMRSLKLFRVPDTVCIVFVLTYKYIFIFARMVEDLYLARKSRLAHMSGGAEEGAWAAGRVAFVFRKTQGRCEEVFQAMVARGMGRSMTLAGDGPIGPADVACGLSVLSFGVVLLWM